jgi:hypothetical protein
MKESSVVLHMTTFLLTPRMSLVVIDDVLSFVASSSSWLRIGSRTLKLHGLLNFAALVVCVSICGLSFGLVTFDNRRGLSIALPYFRACSVVL